MEFIIIGKDSDMWGYDEVFRGALQDALTFIEESPYFLDPSETPDRISVYKRELWRVYENLGVADYEYPDEEVWITAGFLKRVN